MLNCEKLSVFSQARDILPAKRMSLTPHFHVGLTPSSLTRVTLPASDEHVFRDKEYVA